MRLLSRLRLPLACLLLLSSFMHAGPRDSWVPLQVFFYGMPLPLLMAGWIMLGFLCRGKRAIQAGCAIVALGCGISWWKASFRTPAQAAENQLATIRMLSWNMAHKALPSADLGTFLAKDAPDIVGLVEVGLRHSDPNPLVDILPAGYMVQKLDNGMAIVARGTLKIVEQVVLASTSKFAHLEVEVKGVTWQVFIVDGASRPINSRKDVLTRILADVRGQSHSVIMGDFNTPAESCHFVPWRSELHHAFDEAGQGFRETWPSLLPVLTIDHIWTSKDTRPLHAEKRWLASSDHAALLADFAAQP